MMGPVHVLLAHGSRDPEWRWPFERIAGELQTAHPQRSVVLCYLEMWSPSLAEAVFAAHAKGNRDFRITPLFWSRGRHLRDDLPKLVQDLLRDLPDCSFVVDPPVGESEVVRAAVLRLLA
ncbi:CbiX/SirB N-terminal domain-containing protein [Acidithiobacillus sp. AMEEHan]|uniref:sirohydrochlorin chelatase n=1 Tax=Acidithiobacillus sp. AMEEHan TaxID=2994951 RepID=UPI0027E4F3BA|nr:CbiX/SirB N-terminal domain-containing protein [Acidithiobacillus sp. AMEEHan]